MERPFLVFSAIWSQPSFAAFAALPNWKVKTFFVTSPRVVITVIAFFTAPTNAFIITFATPPRTDFTLSIMPWNCSSFSFERPTISLKSSQLATRVPIRTTIAPIPVATSAFLNPFVALVAAFVATTLASCAVVFAPTAVVSAAIAPVVSLVENIILVRPSMRPSILFVIPSSPCKPCTIAIPAWSFIIVSWSSSLLFPVRARTP